MSNRFLIVCGISILWAAVLVNHARAANTEVDLIGGNIVLSNDNVLHFESRSVVTFGLRDSLPKTCDIGEMVNVKGVMYLCAPQPPEWEAIVTEKRKKR